MAEADSPATTPATSEWRHLAANFAHVEAQLAAACDAAGRPREDVRLLPVSKTHPSEAVAAALQLDAREFAESRPQELAAKATELGHLDEINWVMIGRLQTNKAGLIAAHAHEIQSLESLKTAAVLNRKLKESGRKLRTLIQVNVSGEVAKAGVSPEDLPAFLDDLAPLTHLQVCGLMTMAPLSDDQNTVRSTFAGLRELRDKLEPNLPTGMSLDDLSMGMSGDYALAIAEGATTVRIGTALFGARPVP